MPSLTVDTANRLDLSSAEVVHFTHKPQSRPVADQLSLSIVHTHRCTGGEIATRSFEGPLIALPNPLGFILQVRMAATNHYP